MRPAAVLLGALLAWPACAETLTVFAASSLAEPFRELAAAYEAAHPGARVELSLAGSQLLRTQIELGAPADVFASADTLQPRRLAEAGRVEPPQVFARNRLVVAALPEGPVRALADLARPGVRLALAGPEVPAGRYARQALAKLAASGLGAEFASRALANAISQDANVRAALAKVVLGEADAALVYASDVSGAARLRTLEIPERDNVAAEYAVAVVAGAAPGAAAFVALLRGETGRAILRRHGFEP